MILWLTTFAFSIASALLPFLPIEVYILGAGAAEAGTATAISLGIAAGAGATVGKVEEFFAKACFDCDQHFGNPAECGWFLNWYDDTPRDEMRRELLAEVERELALRAARAGGANPNGESRAPDQRR